MRISSGKPAPFAPPRADRHGSFVVSTQKFDGTWRTYARFPSRAAAEAVAKRLASLGCPCRVSVEAKRRHNGFADPAAPGTDTRCRVETVKGGDWVLFSRHDDVQVALAAASILRGLSIESRVVDPEGAVLDEGEAHGL